MDKLAAAFSAFVLATVAFATSSVVRAQDEAGGAAPASGDEPGVRGYHDLDAVAARLAAWVEDAPGRARVLALPRSAGGLRVPAVQLAEPGEIEPERRPTIVFLGGLDGSSLVGAEACLRIGDGLLGEAESLSRELCVVLVPWASPDGLTRATLGLADATASGTPNGRAIDDDGDGAFDEDGPDDVDGDGEVLHMLLEDPNGTWKRAEDARFLERARPGDSPRFELVREGRDDDEDGRFNEDGPGGVVLDRNFPIDWDGSRPTSGPWPLSEPVSRALADLVLERPVVAVVLLQGHHGRVVLPGAGPTTVVRPRDEAAFQRLARLHADVPAAPRRDEHPARGAALDWLYRVGHTLAVEVSPWSGLDPVTRERCPDPYDPAWTEWLDEKQGGIGFLDWSPVQLGMGRTAFVGGWRPRAFVNPPAPVAAEAADRAVPFARRLLAEVPRLEIVVHEVKREGELCEVAASVRNPGGLPSGIDPLTRGRVHLELPADARLVAGHLDTTFEHLVGASSTRELRWLVTVPRGSVLSIDASDDWVVGVTREVRP